MVISPSFSAGSRVHLTGIKGTGMAALAEVLDAWGARVSGSDVAERFFTDEILERLGIVPAVGFSAEHVPADTKTLVYSAAYGEDNPERVEAANRGIPQVSYSQALGSLSMGRPALAVTGAHGKTTTAAMLATIVDACRLDATVVVGSAVPAIGGRATVIRGDRLLIAEACEYRRNFLSFHPDALLVTTIEPDHLDYFADEADFERAFHQLAARLSPAGHLIWCADDPGADRFAARALADRPDLTGVPYGLDAVGPFRIAGIALEAGVRTFAVSGVPVRLRVPGLHNVRNAAAAIAAASVFAGIDPADPRVAAALDRFTGSRRRSEVVADVGGVTVLDDYGHHPTEIRTTLAGFREFYPGRRIIVDFMSHTFSRTRAFLEDFGAAFADADVVILNDIYASARESNPGDVTGETLRDAVSAHHERVYFEPRFDGAADRAAGILRSGDLFVTMGAGDNFRIGPMVVERLGAGARTA